MIDPRFERFLTVDLGTRGIRHSGRDFYTHLKGTHDLLEVWGNRPEVCRAGLFHSVYGTAKFKRRVVPFARRDLVRDLIGSEAEALAYVFCVTARPASLLALIGSEQRVLLDRQTQRLIALSQRQLDDLLEIEAANLCEQGGRVVDNLRRLMGAGISAAAKTHVGTMVASRRPRQGIACAEGRRGSAVP